MQFVFLILNAPHAPKTKHSQTCYDTSFIFVLNNFRQASKAPCFCSAVEELGLSSDDLLSRMHGSQDRTFIVLYQSLTILAWW